MIVNPILKQVFARTRPVDDQLVTVSSTAFPSGHTTTSATIATALAVIAWPTRWRWPVIAAAAVFSLAMAVSRVYLGVHWPSDVVGGLALGFTIAMTVRLLMPWPSPEEAEAARQAVEAAAPAAADPPGIDVVFLDWGNTLMVDSGMREGPMKDWDTVEAEAGAKEALLRLRGRYRLVVATNAEDSPAPDVRFALARVGLDECVDDVITSADVGDHKPNYAFYRAALLHEGVRGLPLDPRRAVMVGDGTTNDIAGAQRAGIRTIWYNPTKRRFPDGAQPPRRGDPQARRSAGGGGQARRRRAGETVPQAARSGDGGGRSRSRGGRQGLACRDGGRGFRGVGRGRHPRREVAMDLSHPEQWLRRALQLGVDAATPIDADAVVAAEWVRMKCLYGCDEPGIRKTCPPNLPPVAVTQRLLSEYRHGVLLEVGPIVGREASDPESRRLNDAALALERDLFLAGHHKAWMMGAGPCDLCEACAHGQGVPDAGEGAALPGGLRRGRLRHRAQRRAHHRRGVGRGRRVPLLRPRPRRVGPSGRLPRLG